MCEDKKPRLFDLSIFVKDYKARERRFMMSSDETNCCIICGRDTSNQKNYYYTLGDGCPLMASHVEDAHIVEDSAGFMGQYPIGSECAKKIIAAGYKDYVHKGGKHEQI